MITEDNIQYKIVLYEAIRKVVVKNGVADKGNCTVTLNLPENDDSVPKLYVDGLINMSRVPMRKITYEVLKGEAYDHICFWCGEGKYPTVTLGCDRLTDTYNMDKVYSDKLEMILNYISSM